MSENESSHWRIWLAILLFAAVLRTPYLLHRLQDIDEGCYAAFATAILDGKVPYREIVDNKFPGIYYTYAIIFALFGNYNMLAVHLVTFFWTCATAVILFQMGSLLASRTAGRWTAFFYLCFTAFFPQNLAANAEIFMALPYALSACLLLLGTKNDRDSLLFLSGLSASVAMIFKQVGGIQLAVGGLYLLVVSLPELRHGQVKKFLWRLTLLVAGFAIPIGLTVLYYYQQGALEDFLFWTLIHIGKYLKSSTAQLSFPLRFGLFLLPYCLACAILWWMAIGWLVRHRKSVRNLLTGSADCNEYLFLLIWLVLSVLTTFSGKRLYPHYYIQFLPPLCLLAGLGAWQWIQRARNVRRVRRVLIGGTVLPSVFSLAIAIPFVGSTPPALWNPDPDFRAATTYVRENSSPQDEVFVWGWFTPLYVYSERKPGTRFLLTNMFVTYKPEMLKREKVQIISDAAITWVEIEEAWDMLQADFEKRPPEIVLDSSPGNYNKFGNFPIQDAPVLKKILAEKYEFDTNIAGVGIYRLKRRHLGGGQ